MKIYFRGLGRHGEALDASVFQLDIIKKGDTLIINGDELDFSFIPIGGEIPTTAIDHPVISKMHGDKVYRDEQGILHIPIVRQFQKFNEYYPEPVVATKDGIIPVPPSGYEEDNDIHRQDKIDNAGTKRKGSAKKRKRNE